MCDGGVAWTRWDAVEGLPLRGNAASRLQISVNEIQSRREIGRA
jgi:hypothetical protein